MRIRARGDRVSISAIGTTTPVLPTPQVRGTSTQTAAAKTLAAAATATISAAAQAQSSAATTGTTSTASKNGLSYNGNTYTAALSGLSGASSSPTAQNLMQSIMTTVQGSAKTPDTKALATLTHQLRARNQLDAMSTLFAGGRTAGTGNALGMVDANTSSDQGASMVNAIQLLFHQLISTAQAATTVAAKSGTAVTKAATE